MIPIKGKVLLSETSSGIFPDKVLVGSWPFLTGSVLLPLSLDSRGDAQEASPPLTIYSSYAVTI